MKLPAPQPGSSTRPPVKPSCWHAAQIAWTSAGVGVVGVERGARRRGQFRRGQQAGELVAGPGVRSRGRSSNTSGTAPQPDQRARSLLVGGGRAVLALDGAERLSAARLARTRATAPEGARSSWPAGRKAGGCCPGPAPAARRSPPPTAGGRGR